MKIEDINITLVAHGSQADILLIDAYVQSNGEGHLVGDECWCHTLRLSCMVGEVEIPIIYHYDTSRD